MANATDSNTSSAEGWGLGIEVDSASLRINTEAGWTERSCVGLQSFREGDESPSDGHPRCVR